MNDGVHGNRGSSAETSARTGIRVHLVIDILGRAGAEKQALLLAGALARSGNDVAVTVLWTYPQDVGDMISEARDSGVVVHRPLFAAPRQRARDIPRAVLELRRRLRRQRADVVHSFLVAADLVAALATAPSGSPVHIVARRNLTAHFNDNGVRSALRRAVVRRCDGVVANSQAVLDDAITHEAAVAAHSAVIHNIIPESAFEKPTSPPPRGRSARLVTVANIRPDKGHPAALDTAQLLVARGVDIHWKLVGGGPQADEIARQAATRGLPVEVVGAVPNPRPFLAEADLYVHPSLSEGMPNAVLEAMAQGRAIVATDVGGTREALADAGELVPPGDPLSLADRIERLLATPKRREELGGAALARALSFGWGPAAAAHTAFYTSAGTWAGRRRARDI